MEEDSFILGLNIIFDFYNMLYIIIISFYLFTPICNSGGFISANVAFIFDKVKA